MYRKDSTGQFIEERDSNGLTRRYRRRRVLGKGGFAKCYQVMDDSSGERYACKVIEKTTLNHSQLREKLQSEIEIHRSLTHQGVVGFQNVFEDEQCIFILLELCPNNTLNELLKRRKILSEVEVRYYLQQLLQAVKYIHKNKVVHRDLKLENFFLTQNLQVKVGDLGLAARIPQKVRRTICGTPGYIAPEILESKNGYSYEVDIWSLGIATYLLLYGRYPFDGSDPKITAARVASKTYLINPSISESAKHFISKMLQIRPVDRFTAKQLLEHQFLTYFDIPKVLPRSSLACSLSSDYLEQFLVKKNAKIQICKDEQEFNFMLESRESPNSPRPSRHSVSHSLSASKILVNSRMENLPYQFSQKKVVSFNYEGEQDSGTVCLKGWLTRWWHFSQYGLLYLTNDNTIGARFNDGSNIKAHPFPRRFTYFQAGRPKQLIESKGIIRGTVNKGILSKIKAFGKMRSQSGLCEQEDSKEEGLFVRLYIQCLNMMVFWMSNGNLQCRFDDRSELIIGASYSLYINPNNIRVLFRSKDLEQQKEEIIMKQQMLSAKITSMSKCGDHQSASG